MIGSRSRHGADAGRYDGCSASSWPGRGGGHGRRAAADGRRGRRFSEEKACGTGRLTSAAGRWPAGRSAWGGPGRRRLGDDGHAYRAFVLDPALVGSRRTRRAGWPPTRGAHRAGTRPESRGLPVGVAHGDRRPEPPLGSASRGGPATRGRRRWTSAATPAAAAELVLEVERLAAPRRAQGDRRRPRGEPGAVNVVPSGRRSPRRPARRGPRSASGRSPSCWPSPPGRRATALAFRVDQASTTPPSVRPVADRAAGAGRRGGGRRAVAAVSERGTTRRSWPPSRTTASSSFAVPGH